MDVQPEKRLRQELKSAEDHLGRVEVILEAVQNDVEEGPDWDQVVSNLHELWRDAERLVSAARGAKDAAREVQYQSNKDL